MVQKQKTQQKIQRKIQRKCVDFEGNIFKPQAIPMKDIEYVNLTKEEITAIYYADYEGYRQVKSAELMGISQASFSRDLAIAHKKIAEALFDVKALLFVKEPIEKLQEEKLKVKK
ncbi:MAG: DUF134 domain-containing protein [Candidatus Heimdallarchaeaceae archaeon]